MIQPLTKTSKHLRTKTLFICLPSHLISAVLIIPACVIMSNGTELPWGDGSQKKNQKNKKQTQTTTHKIKTRKLRKRGKEMHTDFLLFCCAYFLQSSLCWETSFAHHSDLHIIGLWFSDWWTRNCSRNAAAPRTQLADHEMDAYHGLLSTLQVVICEVLLWNHSSSPTVLSYSWGYSAFKVP